MAPANECEPFYQPGSDLTVHAAAAITGCRFVKIAGNRHADGLIQVNHGVGHQFGVARHDIANGKAGPVITAQDVVLPILSGEALAAGDHVTADSVGRAVKVAGDAGDVLHAEGTVVTAASNATLAQVRIRSHSFTIPA